VLVNRRKEPSIRIPDEDHRAIGLRSPYDMGKENLHFPEPQMRMIDVVPEEGCGKDAPKGNLITHFPQSRNAW
jgi:hypothetical protein